MERRVINTAVSEPVVLRRGDSLLVTTDGRITTEGPAVVAPAAASVAIGIAGRLVTTGDQGVLALGGRDARLLVSEGAVLRAAPDDGQGEAVAGVTLGGVRAQVDIAGTIIGESGLSCLGRDSRVQIAETAVLRGTAADGYGLRFDASGADSRLESAGQIVARGVGLVLTSGGADHADVFNTGTITGRIGVTVDMGPSNLLQDMLNSGTITGRGGVALAASGDGFAFTNEGTMRGDIRCGDGAQDVTNWGEILGEIRLGAGDDSFLGQFGALISGAVRGGAGDDWLNGGTADEALHGDAGNDTLFGAQGDDTLKGGGGDDWLGGHAGRNLLTGGAGADTFAFERSGAGLTRITDFRAGAGDVLDLRDFGFADRAEVLALAQAGKAGLRLDLSGPGGGVILLSGLGGTDDLALLI